MKKTDSMGGRSHFNPFMEKYRAKNKRNGAAPSDSNEKGSRGRALIRKMSGPNKKVARDPEL